MRQLWGIDLGGTKIEGVVLGDPDTAPNSGFEDSLDERVVARHRIPTEAGQGYEHIVSRVADLVGQLEEQTGSPRPERIGIGTPGSVVPATGHMKNCNTTCLNGRPLHNDLQNSLGVEVKLANDADCFALAEAALGAGRGHRTVFGVIMGTGVGGGIVVDGKLLNGPNGLTGEWGHMTLDSDGPDCYCGRRGCVETILSGPSIERYHSDRTGQTTKLADIASSHDPACVATIDWMCEWFGRGLAQVVNILDPDLIVLGGGAGQVPQLRTQGLDCLRDNVFGPDFTTPVVLPELGDSAGVFGAALLSN